MSTKQKVAWFKSKRRQYEVTSEPGGQTIVPYHGLEDYIWSSTSAQYDPAYESPRPDRGSSRTYVDTDRCYVRSLCGAIAN